MHRPRRGEYLSVTARRGESALVHARTHARTLCYVRRLISILTWTLARWIPRIVHGPTRHANSMRRRSTLSHPPRVPTLSNLFANCFRPDARVDARVCLIATTKSQYSWDRIDEQDEGIVSRGFVNPCHVTRLWNFDKHSNSICTAECTGMDGSPRESRS